MSKIARWMLPPFAIVGLLGGLAPSLANEWVGVESQLEAIEERTPGRLGVYIKHLASGETVRYQANRSWYLASTTKIPVAIAVLQRVQEGTLSLDQQLTLEESDFVDGSGELLYAEPGTRYSLEELLAQSIRHSDSTATDMLIRLLGKDAFNEWLQRTFPEAAFGRFTTIVQVRFDAYSEIHPDARRLTNMDYVRLRSFDSFDDRYNAFLKRIEATRGQADAESLEAAFERYYERGFNSGLLTGYGDMLERLWTGELLDKEHTHHLMQNMQQVTTGHRRIRAGLPEGTPYAHKTGTQINRACDAGILAPESPEHATVVVACMEGHEELTQAEEAFQAIGRILGDTALH
ncbi:MAG: serine hydrolase [Halorhodospira sp.]